MSCRRLPTILSVLLLYATPNVAQPIEFSAAERAFIEANPRIVVGGEMDWPPMDYAVDGVHTGAASDYLREIAALTGIEFQVVIGYTWAELLAKLRAREIDMLPMMYWTEARGREFNLTNPYITVRHYVFTNGKRPEIRSFEDLHGKRMAIPAGYAHIEYLGRNHPDIEILEVATILDALDALLVDAVDAVIENTASIAYYTANHSLIGLSPAFPVRFEVDNVHMAARSDMPILRDILQKALDSISTESTTRIMAKWTGSEAAAKTFLTTKAELNDAEKAYLRGRTQLTACLHSSRMPFESLRGLAQEGMTADYLTLISDTLKIPIAVRPVAGWNQASGQLLSGQCDLIPLAVDVGSQQRQIIFTPPYIIEKLALATRIDSPFFEALNDVPAATIGVIEGFADVGQLSARHPDLDFTEYAALDEALDAVADGELFGVLDYLPSISHAIYRDYGGTLKISGDFENTSAGISFALRNEDALIASAIAKVLRAMSDSQRLNIHRKWNAVSIEKQPDYTLLMQAAVVGSVILLVFLLHLLEIRKHRREIQLKNIELESINTKLEEQADSALHMAYHDQLTGLPNRAKLMADLDHSIKLCRRTGGKLALLFLDLDRFKFVNDSLGHDVGDQLLQAVAQRICALLRETDTLCRLGGDEFVVMLEALSDAYSPCVVSQRIIDTLQEPFQIGKQSVSIGTSIGISVCPDDTDDLHELVKFADSAMYSAKENGRNDYRYYHEELSNKATRRITIETALRRSLKEQDFSLVLQPIVNLDSRKVVKAEALVRWNHHELGSVPPDEFVPIAEEFGLIVEMGEWVLRKACHALQQLDAEGLGIESVSINTSTVEFLKGDIASRYAAVLEDCGINAQRIEIEITERYMLENNQDAESELRELRRLGHTIAVDDFGTGYSSLSYMKRLPLNTIKIDRSFIQNVPYDQNDVEISQAIISLSRSLGYKVVAEGVETREQLDFLLERSCDFAQGYLFSAPVPIEEFARSVSKIEEELRVDRGWTSRLRILRM